MISVTYSTAARDGSCLSCKDRSNPEMLLVGVGDKKHETVVPLCPRCAAELKGVLTRVCRGLDSIEAARQAAGRIIRRPVPDTTNGNDQHP